MCCPRRSGGQQNIVYAGFRGSKYEATFDFTWQRDPNDSAGRLTAGAVLHWQNPTNYMLVRIARNNGRVRLYRCQDGNLTLDTAGAALRHQSRNDCRAPLGPRCQGLTDATGGLHELAYLTHNTT